MRVLAHEPIDALGIHRPSLAAQLGRDSRPPVARPVECNALDRLTRPSSSIRSVVSPLSAFISSRTLP